MPLWGDTDEANSAPKYLTKDAADADAANTAYFVDTDEAQVANNITKGLKTPGWNLYSTYTTNGGSVTRRRVENLVAMKRTAVQAGDDGIAGNTAIEDTVVED